MQLEAAALPDRWDERGTRHVLRQRERYDDAEVQDIGDPESEANVEALNGAEYIGGCLFASFDDRLAQETAGAVEGDADAGHPAREQ